MNKLFFIIYCFFISNSVIGSIIPNGNLVVKEVFLHVIEQDLNKRKIWLEQKSIKAIESSNDFTMINNRLQKQQVPVLLTEENIVQDSFVVWDKKDFPQADSIASGFEIPIDEITIIKNKRGKIKSENVKKGQEVTIVWISNPIFLSDNYAIVTARILKKISIGGSCSYLLHFNDGKWNIVQTVNCTLS